jgi:V8-like Glu-specific endopeptidase
MLSFNNALAFPVAPFDALKSDIEPPINLKSTQYDFEAIVKLSNCSGSVIKLKDQNLDDQAIVLTNGHCLGRPFLKPGAVVYKKRVRRRMKVSDKNMTFHRIMANQIIYGTMTDTDMALYRLNETYRDLARKGIAPLELSHARPPQGTNIEIISGYWEQGYSCHIDDFVHILQEDAWTFTDSIRYSATGCQVIGGTSGSPIIETGSRMVIGVNNTANESGKKCQMNNPCEVDENNLVTVRKGASYGQQTYQIYNCLNDKGQFDLHMQSCNLPK